MKYYFAQFNRFEIKLSEDCVGDCHHQGDCQADVEQWMEDKYTSKQLKKLDVAKLAEELKEYGAWDAKELADHNKNLMRILWIAAGDIQETLINK